ncbi:MAG: indolepyruvate oxidoreductase subunit beta [Lachnospiraceae bacterium]|nr:indolepyruvate oxidoreductase subunit beta [Lachnospiraceae bacterium]
MMSVNVMIVGVGGQGTLLASRVLGNAVLKKGFDVKVSEVHGMSQRGGSVVTYVRFGDRVYSPIIGKGEADYRISCELLEAARYVSFLKPGGQIIVNSQRIDPMPVITGAAEYPEGIVEKLKESGAQVDELDALSLARDAGSQKAVNIVLMGRFSRYLPDIAKDEWIRAVEECVPEKFRELNLKAFEAGFAS